MSRPVRRPTHHPRRAPARIAVLLFALFLALPLTGGVVAVEPTPTSFVPGVDGPEDETTPTEAAELPTTTMTPAGVPTEQMPPTLADTVPAEGTVTATATATTTPTVVGTMTPTRVATLVLPPDEPAPPKPKPGVTIAVVPKVSVVAVPRPTVPIIPRVTNATVRVSGWICDGDGFDPYISSNWLDLLDHCVTADTFDFELTVIRPGLIFPYFIPLTAGPGVMVETSVPAPAHLRLEHLATGFASAVVDCQSDFSGGVLGGAYPDWRFDVRPGETVECTWFAVRPDSEITLWMDIRVCTADPALALSAPPPSWETFRDLCASTSTVLPVQVDLTNDAPEVNYRGTPDVMPYFDTSTRVVFLDLPPDIYTMTLTLPPGYSHAFLDACGPVAGFGSSVSPLLAMTGSPSSYTADFGTGGTTYRCEWYLVPAA